MRIGFEISMRKRTIPVGLLLVSVLCPSSRLIADVKITEPVGGQNVPCDKALNSTNGPGFVSLGNIVLTEALTTDIASDLHFSHSLRRTLSWPPRWLTPSREYGSTDASPGHSGSRSL